jgi:hypothetical protein
MFSMKKKVLLFVFLAVTAVSAYGLTWGCLRIEDCNFCILWEGDEMVGSAVICDPPAE